MSRREDFSVENLNLGGSNLNRNDGRKMVMALTGVINYNVAAPYTVSLGKIPKGAILLETTVEVVTVFNAVTTNVLTVGTSADPTTLVAAADVNEAAVGTTVKAKSSVLTAETEFVAKYTQTGTAATTGQARCTIKYLV